MKLCRQRYKILGTVYYKKMCVDRDLNYGDSWLHGVMCRRRILLWLTVGCMKLCEDRDINFC